MAWILTLALIVICSLAAFALGLVVGADRQRQRIIAQLAEQLREDGPETFKRVNRV